MHRSQFLAFLFLVACGSGSEAPAIDSTASADTGAARPTLTTPHPDTLVASADMRCDNALEVRANYYRGASPRVVISSSDSGMALPQVVSASGARYANANETIVWWNKGDSAAFTFRGTTTQCGPATGLVF